VANGPNIFQMLLVNGYADFMEIMIIIFLDLCSKTYSVSSTVLTDCHIRVLIVFVMEIIECTCNDP